MENGHAWKGTFVRRHRDAGSRSPPTIGSEPPGRPPKTEPEHILRLSEGANIGLHAVALLAKNPDRPVSSVELAEWTQASRHHLSKILTKLVKAGLIRGTRGTSGGFRLARPPAEITFLDVFEAVEGPMGQNTCPCGRGYCQRHGCLYQGLFGDIQERMRSYFQRRTFADI